MKTIPTVPRYKGFRFPPEIISHAVWLYSRFSLSFRDVEEFLALRGIVVTSIWTHVYQPIALFSDEDGRPAGRAQSHHHFDRDPHPTHHSHHGDPCSSTSYSLPAFLWRN